MQNSQLLCCLMLLLCAFSRFAYGESGAATSEQFQPRLRKGRVIPDTHRAIDGPMPASTDSYEEAGDDLDAAPDSSLEGTKKVDRAKIKPENLPAKTYLRFQALDPVPNDVLSFDRDSGATLHVVAEGPPFIVLSGQIEEGHEASFNNRWLETKDGKFTYKLSLPLDPTTFVLKIFDRQRKFTNYRFVLYWMKLPDALRSHLTDKNTNEETVTPSPFEALKRPDDQHPGETAFVQLYSNDKPVTIVDLDSQKYAKLTFRILAPPDPQQMYDGWIMTIKDSRNETIGEIKRFGVPPSFVDWREVALRVFARDTYTYQIDLFQGEQNYYGRPNRFETIEGLGVLDHDYLPAIQFEPREELGYYGFSNGHESYGGLYVGGDLSLAFFNRFLLRATGLISFHSLYDNQEYTFTRFGAGFRFFADGENKIFGYPHMLRLDFTLNVTGQTIDPDAFISRYQQYSAMIEPHLVLWAFHYIVPFVEFGIKPNLSEQRLSFGLSYYFYIRPWSVKLGLGFAYDKMLYFAGDPADEYTTFRSMVNWIFVL